jgi:hypothetical protein
MLLVLMLLDGWKSLASFLKLAIIRTTMRSGESPVSMSPRRSLISHWSIAATFTPPSWPLPT